MKFEHLDTTAQVCDKPLSDGRRGYVSRDSNVYEHTKQWEEYTKVRFGFSGELSEEMKSQSWEVNFQNIIRNLETKDLIDETMTHYGSIIDGDVDFVREYRMCLREINKRYLMSESPKGINKASNDITSHHVIEITIDNLTTSIPISFETKSDGNYFDFWRETDAMLEYMDTEGLSWYSDEIYENITNSKTLTDAYESIASNIRENSEYKTILKDSLKYLNKDIIVSRIKNADIKYPNVGYAESYDYGNGDFDSNVPILGSELQTANSDDIIQSSKYIGDMLGDVATCSTMFDTIEETVGFLESGLLDDERIGKAFREKVRDVDEEYFSGFGYDPTKNLKVLCVSDVVDSLSVINGVSNKEKINLAKFYNKDFMTVDLNRGNDPTIVEYGFLSGVQAGDDADYTPGIYMGIAGAFRGWGTQHIVAKDMPLRHGGVGIGGRGEAVIEVAEIHPEDNAKSHLGTYDFSKSYVVPYSPPDANVMRYDEFDFDIDIDPRSIKVAQNEYSEVRTVEKIIRIYDKEQKNINELRLPFIEFPTYAADNMVLYETVVRMSGTKNAYIKQSS